VYNLGNGNGYSVLEVVDAVRSVTGRPIPTVAAPRRAGDPATLIASSQLAAEDLGWRIEIPSLEEIVRGAWRFARSLRPRLPRPRIPARTDAV